MQINTEYILHTWYICGYVFPYTVDTYFDRPWIDVKRQYTNVHPFTTGPVRTYWRVTRNMRIYKIERNKLSYISYELCDINSDNFSLYQGDFSLRSK